MKRMALAVCVVLLLAVSTPATAQTYDIADYMMLTPGQWKIEQGQDTSSGETWQTGSVISTQGQYILEMWYEYENGSWVKEDVGILGLTADSLIFYGDYEFEGWEQGFWLLEPPLVIPRTLEVGQAVMNSGVITHGTETIPYAHTLMILEAGVTVTTPAGTFTNCLKIAETDIEGNEVESEIVILAPGLGEVKGWSAEIEEEVPGVVEMDTETSDVIDYGSF